MFVSNFRENEEVKFNFVLVCVNVRRGYDGRSLKLDMINLNSSSSWFHSDELEEQDGTQTVIPRHELMNIVSVTQLEKDTILVAYDSKYSLSLYITPSPRIALLRVL